MQDSRGAILRTISDIREMVDPNAKITMSFFDLTLDNVRDLIKQAKKERIKLHSVQAVQFAEKVF
jgi:hypothetical protein